MTTHELYVNDILMDLDKDVNIYPTYQSPVFTDLQAIVSNRSNSVSLPLTSNNTRAIEMYHLADKYERISAVNTFPRRWHKVRYYRNGIAICEDGRGMITEIEDGYLKFTFYWGNIENFQQLFNKNLNDLTFTDAAMWGVDTKYVSNASADYGFYDINFGYYVLHDHLEYQHPCVNTNFILKKIANENKIKINNIRENKPITDNFLIPCLTKFGDNRIGENANNVYYCEENKLESGCVVPDGPYTDPLKIWDVQRREFNVTNIAKIRVEISESHVKSEYNTYRPKVELAIGDDFVLESYDESYNDQEGIAHSRFHAVNININTSRMNTIDIKFVQGILGKDHYFVYSDPTVRIVAFMDECEYRDDANAYFPLAINLPEMTQADFLRAILQMNGLFAYAKNLNTIDLLSIDDIMANISRAFDWTDRLVNGSANFGMPAQMEFKLSDFAQRNRCAYNNDDEIMQDGSAVLTVNNVTITPKKDAIELPFSQTNMIVKDGVDYAQIPIYKQVNTDIEYDSDLTPRILRAVQKGNSVAATFVGMDWKNLIKTKYAGYQTVIKNPRILNVQCRLSDYDLSIIDFSIPVTFRQFGNHYAVLKIQSVANGLCKCELLELKSAAPQGLPGSMEIPGDIGTPREN